MKNDHSSDAGPIRFAIAQEQLVIRSAEGLVEHSKRPTGAQDPESPTERRSGARLVHGRGYRRLGQADADCRLQ